MMGFLRWLGSLALLLAALAPWLGAGRPAAAQTLGRVSPVPVPTLGVPVAPAGAALVSPTLGPALPGLSALPTLDLALTARSAALPNPMAAVAALRAAAGPTAAPLPVPGFAASAAPSAPRPLRLIVAGPPGSGKGTYSGRIAAEYGSIHISVGDLLREYAKDHPEVAEQMRRGELVDAGLVIGLVSARLARPDVLERGFLLDGFPRRIEEARALSELLERGLRVDAVLVFDAPEGELLRRILGRGRPDDTEPVFRERMRVYRSQTLPALEHMRQSLPALSPDVSGDDIGASYANVRRSLEELLARRPSGP